MKKRTSVPRAPAQMNAERGSAAVNMLITVTFSLMHRDRGMEEKEWIGYYEGAENFIAIE